MLLLFWIMAQTTTPDTEGIASYEKIGIISVLLLFGYLFMTKRIVVGAFYSDALLRIKDLEDELKETRKINHDLRNVSNAAMLQITELTYQLNSSKGPKGEP